MAIEARETLIILSHDSGPYPKFVHEEGSVFSTIVTLPRHPDIYIDILKECKSGLITPLYEFPHGPEAKSQKAEVLRIQRIGTNGSRSVQFYLRMDEDLLK